MDSFKKQEAYNNCSMLHRDGFTQTLSEAINHAMEANRKYICSTTFHTAQQEELHVAIACNGSSNSGNVFRRSS